MRSPRGLQAIICTYQKGGKNPLAGVKVRRELIDEIGFRQKGGAREKDLAARQILACQHETLDALAARQGFDDLGHVRQGHAPVKEMVWLDQNAHTARTLVEATRFTNPRPQLRQAASGDLFLQRRPDFLRPAHRAGTFRVVIRAPVRADKEIALALRHVVKSTAASRRSTRYRRKLFRVRRVLRDSGGRRLRLILRDGRLTRGEQEAASQENERGDDEFFHRAVGESPSLFRPNENRKPLNPRPPHRGMCSCRCRTLASAISLQSLEISAVLALNAFRRNSLSRKSRC